MSDALRFDFCAGTFTVKVVCYTHPEPQGSARAFVRNGHAVITSDNPKMRGYRNDLTREALRAIADLNVPAPFAGQHVPVRVRVDFWLEKPPSAPRKREHPCVKPDVDKLIRATLDALTGVIYADDAQVIGVLAVKHYGTPERVEIEAEILP